MESLTGRLRSDKRGRYIGLRGPRFELSSDNRYPPLLVSKKCLCSLRRGRFTRLGIVTHDFVFVNFQNFQNFVSFVGSQSHLVYDPRAFQTSVGIAEMLTFTLSVML